MNANLRELLRCTRHRCKRLSRWILPSSLPRVRRGGTIEVYGDAWALSFCSFLPLQMHLLQLCLRRFSFGPSRSLHCAHRTGPHRGPQAHKALGCCSAAGRRQHLSRRRHAVAAVSRSVPPAVHEPASRIRGAADRGSHRASALRGSWSLPCSRRWPNAASRGSVSACSRSSTAKRNPSAGCTIGPSRWKIFAVSGPLASTMSASTSSPVCPGRRWTPGTNRWAFSRESGVDHASIYMLEVDDESRLGREMLVNGGRYRAKEVPADDLIADLYTEAIAVLAGHGLAQYEISNFARSGCESQPQPQVLASSSLSWVRARRPLHGAHPRGRNAALRHDRWLRRLSRDPGWTEPRRLDREEEMEEAWFLGLRLNEGVSLAALRGEFSASVVREFLSTIAELEDEGLITFVGRRPRRAYRAGTAALERGLRAISGAASRRIKLAPAARCCRIEVYVL